MPICVGADFALNARETLRSLWVILLGGEVGARSDPTLVFVLLNLSCALERRVLRRRLSPRVLRSNRRPRCLLRRPVGVRLRECAVRCREDGHGASLRRFQGSGHAIRGQDNGSLAGFGPNPIELDRVPHRPRFAARYSFEPGELLFTRRRGVEQPGSYHRQIAYAWTRHGLPHMPDTSSSIPRRAACQTLLVVFRCQWKCSPRVRGQRIKIMPIEPSLESVRCTLDPRWQPL